MKAVMRNDCLCNGIAKEVTQFAIECMAAILKI